MCVAERRAHESGWGVCKGDKAGSEQPRPLQVRFSISRLNNPTQITFPAAISPRHFSGRAISSNRRHKTLIGGDWWRGSFLLPQNLMAGADSDRESNCTRGHFCQVTFPAGVTDITLLLGICRSLATWFELVSLALATRGKPSLVLRRRRRP